MKKVYFLATSLLIGVGAMAQTITSHFEGAVSDPSPLNWDIGVYTWNGGAGYVSGSNAYDDQAILQKFDAAYGISGPGTIDALKIFIAAKEDAGAGTTVTVGIWEDNAGVPGALLGSQVIAISALDTAQAATLPILNGTTVTGIYNLDVVFSTAIDIPANLSFYAGITVPEGAQTAAGDTVVVLTTAMPGYVFAGSDTHAGSLDATDAFYAYGESSVDVANAIFPTITLDAGSLTENSIEASVYPNPANELLNVKTTGVASNVSIISLDGKVISTQVMNGTSAVVNVADLQAGAYFCQVTAEDGSVVTNTFMKK